jgi:hypothetical protein
LGWSGVLPNDILSLFSALDILKRSLVFCELWVICPSTVIWELWKDHNKMIFLEKEREFPTFVNRLEAMIVEAIDGKVGPKDMDA